MTLRFTKMHGAGNNYVYIDLVRQSCSLDWAALARQVSDVNFGLGSDGLILILPGSNGADFRMRVFNADGSEAQMCGNGIRCVAKYVFDHGLVSERTVRVATLAGTLELALAVSDGKVEGVRVDMGKPRLTRAEIPMLGGEPSEPCLELPLEIDGHSLAFTAVSMGNPHVVAFVDDVAGFPVGRVGPQVERHPLFPERTNVEFVRVLSPDELEMRVWERGSGETLACGTGACASLVAASLLEKAGRHAQVHLRGGVLDIEWSDDDHVYMTGPAVEVASGHLSGDWLATALARDEGPSPASRE